MTDKSKGFTDEEQNAMKERAQELKAEALPRLARGQEGGQGKRSAPRRSPRCRNRIAPRRAAPGDHQSQRASLAETLVRDARVCQGGARSSASSKRAEVQLEVRDVRLQRHREPRRRRHVAGLLRAEGVTAPRGKDLGAREESGEAEPTPEPRSPPSPLRPSRLRPRRD